MKSDGDMPSALTCVSAHAAARASAFLTGADRARARATGATPLGASTKNRSAGGTSRFEAWQRSAGSRRFGRASGGTTTAALDGVRLLKFDPSRCSVFFLDTHRSAPAPGRERRYTLTHNDVTRHLTMSVAPDFNGGQTAVWITRGLRDEVLAEWNEDGLHVHCFVSVENHWWLDWASALRSLVFRQKLPLVLDTLRYAERELLRAKPGLLNAPVFVHFHEDPGEALQAGSGYGGWESASGTKSEHWGALARAGTREGKDQRVALPTGEATFSRARDLWTDDAKATDGEGEDAREDVLDVEKVGALIEGALAGGGEVEKVAASR